MATMFILRGIPGSGKSTLTDEILETQPVPTVVASADRFPGLYTKTDSGLQINFALLGAAHAASYRTAIDAMQAGVDVIVDNTNTTREEVAPYMAIAQAYGANVELVTVEADPEVAFQRQTHNVPRAGFDAMVARFDSFEPLPFWQHLPWLKMHNVNDYADFPRPRR